MRGSAKIANLHDITKFIFRHPEKKASLPLLPAAFSPVFSATKSSDIPAHLAYTYASPTLPRRFAFVLGPL